MKALLTVLLALTFTGAFAQTGYHTEYHDNGSIQALYSLNGSLLKVDYFYDNGKIRETGYLFKGKRHGHWQSWSEEGIVVAEAFYHKGNKNGLWLINHENGQVKYELEYKKGKRIAVQHWDSYGNVIAHND